MQTVLNRRAFLASTALATASVTCGAASYPAKPYKIVVGSQLSGWAQYYERMNKKLSDSVDEILSAVRDAGYDYVEPVLNLQAPEECAGFAAKLKARGMAPISIEMTGVFHELQTYVHTVHRYLETAEIVQKAGFSIINCRTQSLNRDKTDAELKTQVAALRQFGDGLNKMGIRLAILPQASELKNGAWEYHYNFRQSPGRSVGFCFDVGWINRAGVLPLDALKEYGARLASWRLRQSREGVWCEDLTTGDVDYEAIAKHAKKYRLVPYYTVDLTLDKEAKITRSAVENHQRSINYLRGLFT